ncbi:sn-glycerol-3-phosphate ABC transporter ATP-binding protein UgpC [Chelatococcus daeguensis]|uniref:Sn-glycerol-3-phosphate ABC transporter ATP-binding protein UgpC n=2 Tax=Chelatococcus TaxID=28209 RepID=A0AAC9JUX5_9HYPH|nr:MULTISPECIES: sn-glycerol-3-phosphate ABC transporter ATP-binding protein UgpC [Chelatococcus]APF39101.1 sn-glycerol-3-phosphate ABC transporter ATP-binding protein UgpC [Chelatococcus daeguensis]KZE27558.1 glycerol-3-phosphate ABC transporter ATP-binding protein [Chelatococcus daeguensis]MBM3085701.1 sn-glycerol-3-phosphate ABC transporter ATP-binding protein UgpC [Chelatococcus daeguensis]CUA84448.1 ABC-type sugar transport system, ATPase component [Chelatococcus sambhunathii]
MSSISIRNVRKAYGKREVVHGVDLEFADGAFVVILGPSGCGKSTLLRMIAGLEEITAGEIRIGDKVVNRLEPRERGCAMVFQNYALYPHMSVAGNIGYALRVAGVPKAERERRVAEVARVVGLENYLSRRPGELSGGQRQRVAMGRAIVREPKVFLFDEPLSNLDAKLRVQMRAEIRRLHKRLAATSVFVTHDQVEAMTLADTLVVMNGGRVEQVGAPAEVYHRPRTRFVGAFIGAPAMNFIDGTMAADSFTFDGRRVAVEWPFARAHAGRPVALGVRPEQVELVAADSPGALPATVDFVEELGAGRVVYTDIDGLPFAVTLSEETDLAPGERVGLKLLPQSLHFFDGETGLRLGLAESVETSRAAVAAA